MDQRQLGGRHDHERPSPSDATSIVFFAGPQATKRDASVHAIEALLTEIAVLPVPVAPFLCFLFLFLFGVLRVAPVVVIRREYEESRIYHSCPGGTAGHSDRAGAALLLIVLLPVPPKKKSPCVCHCFAN